jgi:hypothetical protein
VTGGVEVGVHAVVHILDLHAAEARVGDLVHLAGDLGGVDQAVRPPPADLGLGSGVLERDPDGLARPGRPGRGNGHAEAEYGPAFHRVTVIVLSSTVAAMM